jgi:hypothetical protein
LTVAWDVISALTSGPILGYQLFGAVATDGCNARSSDGNGHQIAGIIREFRGCSDARL